MRGRAASEDAQWCLTPGSALHPSLNWLFNLKQRNTVVTNTFFVLNPFTSKRFCSKWPDFAQASEDSRGDWVHFLLAMPWLHPAGPTAPGGRGCPSVAPVCGACSRAPPHQRERHRHLLLSLGLLLPPAVPHRPRLAAAQLHTPTFVP